MVEIVMQLGSHINVEKEIAHGNITAEIFTFGSFFFSYWKKFQSGILAVNSCNIIQRWRCIYPS